MLLPDPFLLLNSLAVSLLRVLKIPLDELLRLSTQKIRTQNYLVSFLIVNSCLRAAGGDGLH